MWPHPGHSRLVFRARRASSIATSSPVLNRMAPARQRAKRSCSSSHSLRPARPSLAVLARQAGNVQVQATVASVAAGSVTLTVNGQQLTINLPAGLTLPATVVGTQVTLNVSFAGGAATAAQNGQHEDDDEADADEGGGGDD